jgi:hypothetical protein
MKTILLIILTTFLPLTDTYSQETSMFDSITRFMENNQANKNASPSKYSFITKPDGTSKSAYTVNCWLANGVKNEEFSNLKVSSIRTNFINYDLRLPNGKAILVPIDSCYIKEN